MAAGEAITLATIAASAGMAAAKALGKTLAVGATAPAKRKINAWLADKRLEAAYSDAARAFLKPLTETMLGPQDLANLAEMVKAEPWTEVVSELVFLNFEQIDTNDCRELFRALKPAGTEESFFDAGWQRLTRAFQLSVASSESEPLKFLVELTATGSAARQRHEGLRLKLESLESSQRVEALLELISKQLAEADRGKKTQRTGKKRKPSSKKRKSGERRRQARSESSRSLAAIEAARGAAQKEVLDYLDNEVSAYLIDQCPAWRGKTKAALACALCDAGSLSAVAPVLNLAHDKACRDQQGGPAAEKLEHIAARVVPTVFWAQMGIAPAKGRATLSEEVPIKFDALIELLFAGLEQKKYAFSTPESETAYPKAINRLPLPAEDGIRGGAESFDEFIDHLANERLHLDPSVWCEFEESQSDRIEYLDAELELAASGTKGRRRYLTVTEKQYCESAELFEQIESRLRGIHVAKKVGKPSPKQIAAFLPIRALLARANARRKSD